MKRQKIKKLERRIAICTACRLHKKRKNAVPGEGPIDAKIFIIGEGPGEYEDINGRPFIGRSGKLLTKLLEEAGVKRDGVYITNTVKCRPPKNRDPLLDEIHECKKYLMKQLDIIKPRTVILVGRVAKALFNLDRPITEIHGICLRSEKHGFRFMPVYHPAYALRNKTAKEELAKDLKTAVQLTL